MPTSGSIYARWSIVIDGAGIGGSSGGNQAWEGTVTFP
jgi:hypothetical protein